MNSAMLIVLLCYSILGSISGDKQAIKWIPTVCPSKCACTLSYIVDLHAQLRLVNCSYRDLTQIPKRSDIPNDAQVLLLNQNRISHLRGSLHVWPKNLLQINLSGNQIRNLGKQGPFGLLTHLRHLDLSHNHLSYLRGNIFEGLFNVEMLKLNDNRLSAIHQNAFAGLLKLEQLVLAQNRITHTVNGWWRHIPNLYQLDLSHNLLSIIQKDSLLLLHKLIELDLSWNKIFQISSGGFEDLHRIEYLKLDGNRLKEIPSDSFQPLSRTLKSVSLNHSPIYRVKMGDFNQLYMLRDISLCNMPRLRVIDAKAFIELPSLLVLQIHDNPHLSFIDPSALYDTPKLIHLLLHNNNLRTLADPSEHASVDSIQEISFYGNPIACNCGAHWIKSAIDGRDNRPEQGKPFVQFREASRMICNSPSQHKYKILAAMKWEEIPVECEPTIVDLFDDVIKAKINDEIILDCRADGVPKAKVTWMLPTGSNLVAYGPHSRIRLMNNGATLIITGVRQEDAGTYVCLAENSKGARAVQSQIHVSPMDFKVSIDQITSTSATLQWQASENGSTNNNNLIQIIYRQDIPGSRHEHGGIIVPAMGSYTLEGLHPSTNYEGCITMEDASNIVVHLSCVKFQTKLKAQYLRAIRQGNRIAIGATLGVIICMLTIVCMALVFARLKPRSNLPGRVPYTTLALVDDSNGHPKIELHSSHRHISKCRYATTTTITGIA